MAHSRKIGRLTSRATLIAPAILLVSLFALASACAPFTYNRYQTAQTLGRGEMKLMAAADLGGDLASLVAPDMQDKMDEKLDVWTIEHPEYAYLVDRINDDEFFTDFDYTGLDGSYPDGEVIFAVGVHDRIDVEVRFSSTLYARLNTKIMLAKFGDRGAFSIAPGIGWRTIQEQEFTIGHDLATDSYKGNGYTAELPFILGWQFDHVSPFIAPTYTFHFMEIDYTRLANVVPTFKSTDTKQFYVHQAGLIIGAQFKLGDLLVTPEVVGQYHISEDLSLFAVYPGLAIGASW